MGKVLQSNGLAVYLTEIKHEFRTYENEIQVENGSAKFHELRADSISASRIAEVVGLSKYGMPRGCAEGYYTPKEENEAMILGKTEEPHTREDFLKRTRWRVPLRECGMFFMNKNKRMSAMPDDVAFINGAEVCIEYKFLCHPYANDYPKLEHVCQCVWQLGISGMRSRGYLVYRWKEGDEYKMRVWEIVWSEKFFRWMMYRAVLFSSYLDNPCTDTLPCYSHNYHAVNNMLQKGTWFNETVNNDATDMIPPGPCVHKLDFGQLCT